MSNDNRTKELATIHMLKKKLGLSDENYRVLLEAQTGLTSAGDLEPHQRRAVIAEMQRQTGQKVWHKPRVTVPDDKLPMLKKVYALLDGRPIAYAEGILAQMFKSNAPTCLEWATHAQLHKLIAALEIDRRRNAHAD